MSEYPSRILLLALRYLEDLCVLLLQVEGDHADLLPVLDHQDRGVLGGEVETPRLPEDPLQADIAAIEGRVLDVHVHQVLQAIPNLKARVALHADSILVQTDPLNDANGFIEERPLLAEADLESLLVDLQQEETLLTGQEVAVVSSQGVTRDVVDVSGLSKLQLVR